MLSVHYNQFSNGWPASSTSFCRKLDSLRWDRNKGVHPSLICFELLLEKRKKEHSMALTMHCSFAQATGRISLDAPPWFSHFRRQLHRVPFIYFR